MQKLLMISLDAVGDREFDKLMKYPNFNALMRGSTAVRGVDTVFLSNTYPIHASVVTGVVPGVHGIVSNTEPFPKKEKNWYSNASRFRVRTLWQSAAEKGYDTAAVMWPVTAGAKEIAYNIPEVMAKSGQSQMLVSLLAGSKGLQVKEFLKHRGKLKGIKQPELDDFSTSCMLDIMQEHKPELMLMHLTSYDFICHEFGKYSSRAEQALAAVDENLGRLMEAADEDTCILAFSDHSQLHVHTNVVLNDMLVKMGLLKKVSGGYDKTVYQCFFECCGGSAFFHAGILSESLIDRVKKRVELSSGFGRFLTESELAECGRRKIPFGFSAAKGYSYSSFHAKERANHGYPADYDNYQVFYAVGGKGIEPGRVLHGGSILDITPIAAEVLDVEMTARNLLRKEVFMNEGIA